MRRICKIVHSLLLSIKYKKIKFKHLGNRCVFRSLWSNFAYPENITIEDDVHIGPDSHLDGTGGISIGRGTILAPEVLIYSRTHNFYRDLSALPYDNLNLTAPVTIGEYVWIGARAIILPGAKIGDGAVIGAGAVVASEVPSCAVVVGNPARVVRYRDKDVFEKLRAEENVFVYTRYGHSKKNVRK